MEVNYLREKLWSWAIATVVEMQARMECPCSIEGRDEIERTVGAHEHFCIGHFANIHRNLIALLGCVRMCARIV